LNVTPSDGAFRTGEIKEIPLNIFGSLMANPERVKHDYLIPILKIGSSPKFKYSFVYFMKF